MPEIQDLEKRFTSLADAESCAAFEADIVKFEKNLQQQITLAQGQLQAIAVIKRLLLAHKNAGAVTEKALVEPIQQAVNLIEEERLERLAQRKCTFRSRDKKWCARQLRTKTEQEHGYCKIHIEELGIQITKKRKTGDA